MKKEYVLSGLIVVALGLGAVGASASPYGGKGGHRMHMGPMQMSFEELDADKDGKLTPEEMAAHHAARFAEADTDGDGKLSADEMQAAIVKRMTERAAAGAKRMIERRDVDGDGMLSAEEMAPKGKRAARMFDRMDDNEDGAISAEEFAEARKHMQKRMGHRRDKQRRSDN